jgi:hypothetical protein
MSKKKNTLNDLEEFLKLQASALVTPSSLTEKVNEPAIKSTPVKSQVKEEQVVIHEESLIEKIKSLSTDKKAFYNLIIEATENLPDKSPEDTLLINTALYLKGGSHWKEMVSAYWKQKK